MDAELESSMVEAAANTEEVLVWDLDDANTEEEAAWDVASEALEVGWGSTTWVRLT